MNPNISLAPSTSKSVLALALMCCLSACGGDAPASGNSNGGSSQSPGNTAPTPNAPADNRPAIYLDGLYATSTAPGQSVAGLFDNDPATNWRTQNGAGPDEGVMLYFSERQQVNVAAIEVAPADGAFAGDNASVQLYVNGHLDKSGKPGTKISLEPLRKDDPLRSIFVRIAETGREQSRDKTTPEGKTTIKTFPKDASVGLKQIMAYDAAGNALRLVPPRRVSGSVSASSVLAPEAAYSGANLFDARKEFAWVEGNASGSGEGETLTFEFSEPVNISSILVWNGYQRSPAHYSANARAKGFSFGEKGGLLKNYTLADRMAPQKVALSAAAKGRSFEFKIDNIYKGGKYKDLAISDIVFFDGDQPFVLASNLGERFENDLRGKAAGSPLASLLNQRVFNDVEFASMLETQSLILRSDGTFVMYYESQDGDMASQTLADGNWELVEANAQSAKVKVFGKWYDFSSLSEYYKGNTENEVTKIFNDVLTIDATQIKGGKMMGNFVR